MESFKKISDAMQFSAEKMKKNGIFETERFFCDLYCFEPGQTQPAHTHEGSDKVYYVIEGSADFVLGEEPAVEARAGDVVVVPRGVPYEFEGHMTYLVINAPAFVDGDDVYL